MVMSDDTHGRLREEVRERYAQAALVVLGQAPGASAGCCGSSAADSCCGTGLTAAEAVGGFSEGLYREGETDGLPVEAVREALHYYYANKEWIDEEVDEEGRELGLK